MKKTISILLVFCILFSLFTVNASAAYSTPEEIKLNFDYNGDGKINLADARTVLRVSANLEEPKEGLVYDVTGNGDGLTMEDVKKIIGIVTGIDTEVNECAEFNFELFKAELNSVKEEKPGVTKKQTKQCTKSIISMSNNLLEGDSYNFSNIDYVDYLNNYSDMSKAEIDKAKEEKYSPVISVETVNKWQSHWKIFPISSSSTACYLTFDDIKSIVCYEKDGYIVREVTLNDESFNGTTYPTGGNWLSSRFTDTTYGKVFNIPQFNLSKSTSTINTSGSSIKVTLTPSLNAVSFKSGKITSVVDKLSGIPKEVTYEHVYTQDMSTQASAPITDKITLIMDSTYVDTFSVSEVYTINPVTKN